MFGNLNKPAFGAAAPNNSFGFGATTQANPNPFGQNQLFGKPATAAFGSPSTSTFGQPPNTSLFPSSQPQTTNLFQNANTSFGTAPTAQPSFGTNLFGQQQPSTSGLFNNPTTAFGQQNKPAGFGFASQTQPSLFGQQPQTAQSSNLFQPATGNLFGATPGFGGQQSGTVLKFNPVTGTDTMMKNGVAQSINTKHHSITCMKEYDAKSFEELRWEDYQANRKGPQQQTGFGATPFGATATSAPSLFGQQDATKTFGQTAGFGQTATSTFGQTNTGFGMATQQTPGGGLFGKPTGFGAPTSSTNSFGFNTTQNANPFGAKPAITPFSNQPLFGQTAAQPAQTGFGGGGLFGTTTNQNATTNLFGKPAQPATGFNQPQNTGFSFNQPNASQPSTLFPNTNKPTLFGTNTGTTGFGQTNSFGQTNQPSFGNTFGKPVVPTFGQTTQTTGGFGGNLGGGLQPGNNLFGNTAAKPGGGLFGNTGTTGLFGGGANTTFQTNTGFGMQTQQQQQSIFPPPESEYKNLAFVTSDPFGEAPHLTGLEPKARSDPAAAVATNPDELKSLLDASKKVDMSHNNRLKVMPLKSLRETLFHYKKGEDTMQYSKTNCRRLVIKSRPPENGASPIRSDILSLLNSINEQNNSITTNVNNTFDSGTVSSNIQSPEESLSSSSAAPVQPSVAPPPVEVISTEDEGAVVLDSMAAGDQAKPSPCGIVCTRPEYYTLPNLDELSMYVDEKGVCLVKGFTVGRKGYGNVYFPDEIDIAGLNIDELVHFRYREINIYPDESKKPPVGQGLNRRAQVTLDNVYPRKSGTNALITDTAELLQMNFAEKLRIVTVKKGAKFVDYRPETGSWVFKVEHFSKYGYNESDEESTEPNGIHKKVPDEKTGKLQKATKKIKEVDVEKVKEPEATSTKYGLDHDICIEDEDQSGSEEYLLSQSMYLDMSDNVFHSDDFRMPHNYDSLKTSKTIQVMKSTLFADDGSSDGGSSHASIIRQYLDLPEEGEELPMLPVIREEMRVEKKRVMERPQVFKVYNFGGSEVTTGVINSRCCLDMAAFKGKCFKVGWGKGASFMAHGETNGQLSVSVFSSGEGVEDPLKNYLLNSLEIVLKESEFTLDSQQVPTFKISKSGGYLRRQSELFETIPKADYLHSIWTLCEALWGPGKNSIARRRYSLGKWLQTCTQATQTISPPKQIFQCLSVFKIAEAAQFAMQSKHPNLSLIISQVSLANRTKLFLPEQVETWYNSLTSDHISHDLKRIYLLLAGIPTKDDVNVLEDVDWKRAFGMHLWYMCSNGAPVEEAIELYKRAFESGGYAVRPLPPYCAASGDETQAFDVLYHVLLLYKSRIHRLSCVLNPATHTKNPLDYRMSWLLLRLFESLDIGLIEQFEKVKFHTSFACQLENLGHWEWAIFTLLHLEDNTVKKRLITGILDRNLPANVDKCALRIQNKLVNEMHLPASWIHVVKATKYLQQERYFEAFNNFAHAQEYVKANDIMIDKLLPGLFINSQYDIIKDLLRAIEPGKHQILKWQQEAGLFRDFLQLQEEVITARNEDLLRLQSKLQLISNRIGGFPLRTNQQKLCMAEMAKRAASVYKELYKRSGSGITLESYADFVDGLEMPPDFKYVEAMFIINESVKRH